MLGMAKWSIYISKSFCVSEFGKVEITSTPAESSFFRALALYFIITYIPNLYIPQKILRGGCQDIFKKKTTVFRKKGVEIYRRLTV